MGKEPKTPATSYTPVWIFLLQPHTSNTVSLLSLIPGSQLPSKASFSVLEQE